MVKLNFSKYIRVLFVLQVHTQTHSLEIFKIFDTLIPPSAKRKRRLAKLKLFITCVCRSRVANPYFLG